MNKKIEESLNIAPAPIEEAISGEVLPPSTSDKPEDQTSNDYKYARENFYNVIEKGSHALEDMLDVARSSEHPRAYEVVSTLIKTLVDANKDLVELSKKQQQAEKKEGQGEQHVTNNNMFVGNTAEFQKMIKSIRDGDD